MTNPLLSGAEARAYANRRTGGNQHAFPLQLVGDFESIEGQPLHMIRYDYRSLGNDTT